MRRRRSKTQPSRREFLKATLVQAAVAPVMITRSPLGPGSPNDHIQVAAIGVGRISRGHDMPGVLKYNQARIIAVCDLDSKRCVEGKQFVEEYYRKRGLGSGEVKSYGDYRELLLNPEVDAVIISTPDHWHARPTMDAVRAGKDVYLQKPASLTIAEGRLMADAVHHTGRIVQVGTQQRSWPQFRIACELVRNGRIGQVHTIEIGLPVDPSGSEEPEMPVPKNLNYDMWLGSTSWVYYTEKRVHPQNDYSRPGWLRCEQFGAGMITGWGAHHVDIAHWGMGTEYTGPIEIQGSAEFPKSGLWDVHDKFRIEAKYANGVTIHISDTYPNGVRFEGSEGWIFVTRGSATVTPTDPTSGADGQKVLSASDPQILSSAIGPNEIHLYRSDDQHGNWLECIRTRRQPISPVEIGHRSCSACLLGHIAMKLPRRLYWDPLREWFKNDDEANTYLSRPQRPPYHMA